MIEIWKDVVGFDGYKVSNLGHVKTIKFGRDKILFESNSKGYKTVTLYKNGKKICRSVHRLVAIAFIPNPNNLPQIDHIDGNRANANVNNLRWCTAKENQNFELAHINRITSHTQKEGKCIMQFTFDGKLVSEWKSIKEASRALNITREGIRDCCLGKQKSAFGFVWKYKE